MSWSTYGKRAKSVLKFDGSNKSDEIKGAAVFDKDLYAKRQAEQSVEQDKQQLRTLLKGKAAAFFDVLSTDEIVIPFNRGSGPYTQEQIKQMMVKPIKEELERRGLLDKDWTFPEGLVVRGIGIDFQGRARVSIMQDGNANRVLYFAANVGMDDITLKDFGMVWDTEEARGMGAVFPDKDVQTLNIIHEEPVVQRAGMHKGGMIKPYTDCYGDFDRTTGKPIDGNEIDEWCGTKMFVAYNRGGEKADDVTYRVETMLADIPDADRDITLYVRDGAGGVIYAGGLENYLQSLKLDGRKKYHVTTYYDRTALIESALKNMPKDAKSLINAAYPKLVMPQSVGLEDRRINALAAITGEHKTLIDAYIRYEMPR